MANFGIDSGGSITRLWDGEHEVLKLKTPYHYAQYLQLLQETLKPYEPIHTLTIALAAIIEKQRIVRVVNLGNDWNGEKIETDLRNLLQIRGNVHVLQDTEAAGYAVQKQWLCDLEPTMLITLSTGVGGALVTKDRVMPLEIGHISLNLSGNNAACECGQYGCTEADLSGTGIYKRLGIRAENVEDREFWSNYGTEFGKLLMVLSALFKLKQIILIGGVSQRHHLFLEQTNRYLADNLKYVPKPTIRVLQPGDNTGVYGAHWFAARR